MTKKYLPIDPQSDSVIQLLNITLPTSYEANGSTGAVQSKEVQSLARSYLAIIRKLLSHINSSVYWNNQDKLALQKETTLQTQITERINTRLQTLVSKFGQLKETGDMMFQTGNEVIHAHSAIVMLWSEPFSRMLNSTMREGTTKKIQISEDPAIVKMMVSYFYTAHVEMREDNALSLLRMSALYEISSLRELCFQYLLKNITIANCIPLFFLSEPYSDKIMEVEKWTVLYKDTCSFIRSNPCIVVQHIHTLANLDLDLLSKIWPLFQAAKTEEKNAAFLAWAKRNWDVDDLFQCINVINASLSTLDELALKSNKCALSQFPLEYFLDFCKLAIIEDFDSQSKKSGFFEIDVGSLIAILQHDTLNVVGESVVLDSITSWIQAVEGRSVHLPQLLECIRFPFIDITYLMKLPTVFPVVNDCSAYKSLLQDAIKAQLDHKVFKRPAEAMETKEEKELGADRRKMRRTNINYKFPTWDSAEFASFVTSAVVHLYPSSSPSQTTPSCLSDLCSTYSSSTSTPSVSTPSASAPSASTPSASTPSASTPSASTPSASTPSASTPSASIPSASIPSPSSPSASSPSASTPATLSPCY